VIDECIDPICVVWEWDPSCGREALRHSRFAVWPARRAKGAGMVSKCLSVARVRPQWAGGVESESVALEGSSHTSMMIPV
jgi:hypothetical protein